MFSKDAECTCEYRSHEGGDQHGGDECNAGALQQPHHGYQAGHDQQHDEVKRKLSPRLKSSRYLVIVKRLDSV